MSKASRSKIVLTAAILIVLVLSGGLAYAFLPGRGSLPDLPALELEDANSLPASSPEAQGLDSDRIARQLRSIQEQGLAMDSLLMARHGQIVVDAYFAPYDGSFPHDMGSVAKSVTGILVGIAIDRGLLQLDQAMVSFFPGRSIANLDERKASITVEDLVSMRNGMESQCRAGDEPTLDAMRTQPDWIQAALDRPMVEEPGTQFCYDSPGMHLLSAILQEASGMSELEFARQVLFEPLGIREVTWESDPQGYTHGWGDLHLLPQDAARLGLLYLHGGDWGGQQIVSREWVTASVSAQSRLIDSEYGYGYGWWVSPFDFYAEGRDGQFIRVLPWLDTVLVLTGGSYEIDAALPALLKMLAGSAQPKAENPAGLAELQETISNLAVDEAFPAQAELPGTARTITGIQYACDPNPVSLNGLRLEFDDSPIASLYLTRYGVENLWPVGLDGRYRLAESGQAQRGAWEDEHTFALEVFDIGQLTRRITFNGSSLALEIPEAGMSIACHASNP